MSFVITRSDGTIVQFDAVINYSTTWSNMITDHPVEDGSTVTDHIVNQNPVFNFEGIVSDAALAAPAPGNHAQVSDILEAMWKNREIFKLTVDNRSYSNVTFENIELPKDVSLHSTLKVVGTLRQIFVVANAVSTVPAIDRDPAIADAASDKNSKGANQGTAVRESKFKEAISFLEKTLADGATP